MGLRPLYFSSVRGSTFDVGISKSIDVRFWLASKAGLGDRVKMLVTCVAVFNLFYLTKKTISMSNEHYIC